MTKNLNILKSLNILYAEDDLVIKQSISRILKKCFLKKFYSKLMEMKLLEIYQNNKIDVLLLDYVMPNLDGYQTAKNNKRTTKKFL